MFTTSTDSSSYSSAIPYSMYDVGVWGMIMCGTKRLYVGADVFMILAKIEQGPLLLKVQTVKLYYFPCENILKHTKQRGDVNVRIKCFPCWQWSNTFRHIELFGVSLCLAIYDNMTDLHTGKTSVFQPYSLDRGKVMFLQDQQHNCKWTSLPPGRGGVEHFPYISHSHLSL